MTRTSIQICYVYVSGTGFVAQGYNTGPKRLTVSGLVMCVCVCVLEAYDTNRYFDKYRSYLPSKVSRSCLESD